MTACSFSVLIVCRLHLDLQTRAHRRSRTWSLPTISIGSFHAATHRMHDGVATEFEDGNSHERVGSRVSYGEVNIPAGTTSGDIGLAPPVWASENTAEA
jgi:hypothetical protein